MTVLAFDTSGSVLSLTLLIAADGGGGTGEGAAGRPEATALHVVRDTGLHHAEHLAGSVRDLLASAGVEVDDVELVACAGGPGSFTGLRIGMSTAKGLAAARGTPFVAVPTLDIWAEVYGYWPGVVVPAMDARKGRFYAALYAGGEKLTGDLDEAPESILERAREAARGGAARNSPGTRPLAGSPAILVAGPDATALAAAVDAPGLVVAPPSDTLPSHALARIARARYEAHGAAPGDLGPSYVRKSDAELGA